MSHETFTGFTPAPDCIRDQIGHNAAYVFGAVWRFSQLGRGQCDATVDTLSKRSGLGTTVTRECLRSLEDAGWIEAEQRPGRTTVYRDTGRWVIQVVGEDTQALPKRIPVAPQREALPTPTDSGGPPQRIPVPKTEEPKKGPKKGPTTEDLSPPAGGGKSWISREVCKNTMSAAFCGAWQIPMADPNKWPARYAGMLGAFTALCWDRDVRTEDWWRFVNAMKAEIKDGRPDWGKFTMPHNCTVRFGAWLDTQRDAGPKRLPDSQGQYKEYIRT